MLGAIWVGGISLLGAISIGGISLLRTILIRCISLVGTIWAGRLALLRTVLKWPGTRRRVVRISRGFCLGTGLRADVIGLLVSLGITGTILPEAGLV